MDIIIQATTDEEQAELDLSPRADAIADPFGSIRLEGMVDYAICGRGVMAGIPVNVCRTRVAIASNGIPDRPGLLAAIRYAEEIVRMYPEIPVYTAPLPSENDARGDDPAQRE